MSFSRAWMILTLVWAVTSLLLAPMITDAFFMGDGFANTVFFWCLLVVGALIPLTHEFVHPQRPYRRVILGGAIFSAAFFAFALNEGRSSKDIYWIPVAWACVLGLSDWLFIKAQTTVAARPVPKGDVKARLRGYAANNTDRAIEAFDTNVAEFRKVFLDKQRQGGPDFQLGSVSLLAAKDFLATKFGMEAALAALYIVYQRVYDDPRKSPMHSQLLRHLSTRLSEISLPDQEARVPYLTDADCQKVWDLVIDPKYSGKMDELRLAVVMVGLFAGTHLKPPLAEEEDREALMQLMKRTLNRMRLCLQK